MAAFGRLVKAGIALAGALVAGPAAALTLTFQVDVTGSSGGPPIDDFQMTWTFDPVFFDVPGAPTYYGDVAGIVDTPQNAAMFAVAGIDPPFEPPFATRESWALFRTIGDVTSVDFTQHIIKGDEATDTFGEYRNQIDAGGVVPGVAYTPGGFVYLLQTLGGLQWGQTATRFVEGETVDSRIYVGTAHLVAWDVEPEIPPIPEPGTWALMILGFGLTGAALRRREVRAAI